MLLLSVMELLLLLFQTLLLCRDHSVKMDGWMERKGTMIPP